MRKLTNNERCIITRMLQIHKDHPNIRIPAAIIFAPPIQLQVGNYGQSIDEAIKYIVQNYNAPSLYETAVLLSVLEENGYILLDKDPRKNPYQEQIKEYEAYIDEIQRMGLPPNSMQDDNFPFKRLFGRISPKFANMLLNQIYANILIFDSLVELAKDEFLTEEGQMLKEAKIQRRVSIGALIVAILTLALTLLYTKDNKSTEKVNESKITQVNKSQQEIDTIQYIEYIVDEPVIDTTQKHIPRYKLNN